MTNKAILAVVVAALIVAVVAATSLAAGARPGGTQSISCDQKYHAFGIREAFRAKYHSVEDPFRYVDCEVARCHRLYAKNAFRFRACVGIVGRMVDPYADDPVPW
jgi:hypothetical protein